MKQSVRTFTFLICFSASFGHQVLWFSFLIQDTIFLIYHVLIFFLILISYRYRYSIKYIKYKRRFSRPDSLQNIYFKKNRCFSKGCFFFTLSFFHTKRKQISIALFLLFFHKLYRYVSVKFGIFLKKVGERFFDSVFVFMALMFEKKKWKWKFDSLYFHFS